MISGAGLARSLVRAEGSTPFWDRYRSGGAITTAAIGAASTAVQIVPDRAPFSVTVRTWYCSRLLITRWHGDGLLVRRSARQTHDRYDAFVQFAVVAAGLLHCHQAHRSVSAIAGQVLTVLQHQPYEVHAADGSDATHFYVPVTYLEARGIRAGDLAARGWRAEPLVAPLIHLSGHAMSLPSDSASAPSRAIEAALLELLVGLVIPRQDGQRPRRNDASLREQVLAVIESEYADRALSVGTIAESFSVSRRFLYGAFAGHGPSIAAIIRARRVRAAQALLDDPATRNLPAARIAELCGFTGTENLGRALKATTGLTLTQARARAAGQGTPKRRRRLGGRGTE